MCPYEVRLRFLSDFRHLVIQGRRGLIGFGEELPMKRMLVVATILAWVPSAAAWAQNVGGGGVFPPNEVDQIKVDMAIEKGIKYLKANNASHLGTKDHVGRKMSNRELVLFTYVHS